MTVIEWISVIKSHFVDDDVYHIDASLKDLAKNGFAFSKMDKVGLTVMAKVEEVLCYGG